MYNPYQPKIAVITKIQTQTLDVKLFTLHFKNKKDKIEFIPGQIVEVGIPGFGEGPFALCSDAGKKDVFQLCIRRAGRLTAQIHKLKVGDFLNIRGPYGNGFPEIKDKNLLLICGGLGIIPLRPLILTQINNKTNNLQIFYGARAFDELLFKDEYKNWRKFFDLQLTLDRSDPKWSGHVGLITTLFDDVKLIDNAAAILCGPPVMYKFVLAKLKEHNFADRDIYMSLERRMHCGFGVCQHCTIGSKYVCKDGPIFSYAELKNIPGAL